MKINVLQTRRALRTALLVLLLSVVGMGKMNAQDFAVGDLLYSVNYDGISVTVAGHVNGQSATGALLIPESVSYGNDSYFVTAIESRAFSFCVGLTSLSIGNSLVSIGDFAFSGCSGLTMVSISNSVTSIGEYAFCDCNSIISLIMGNSLTTIGDYAFSQCRGLTSITIPDSVMSIGICAFYDCISLSRVNISNLDAWCRISFSYSSNPLRYAHHLFLNDNEITNLTLPSSVTSIKDYTFSGCSGLASVTIPNHITSIGNRAFSGCCGLTSITIPNQVNSIGVNPFEDCESLERINVETGNQFYDSRNGCNAIINTSDNNLVTGCKNTLIPNSVTSIGGSAFSGCTGLNSIVIPNSVTTIGMVAFSDCTNLYSINIPKSVVMIGGMAFVRCSSIEEITVETDNQNFDSRDGCNAIINTASNTLILGCKNTIIPNTVAEIGEDAFSGCSGLTSIAIPDSVRIIGKSAFYSCNGLTTFIIPNSVTKIENNAFMNCSGLTSVVIGNSVTTIGGCAFEGCISMTSIAIPNSVTTINGSAFGDCTNLSSIIIPNSVNSISSWAFRGCSSLACIISLAEQPPYLGYEAFVDVPCNTLVVPCESKDDYETSDWAIYFTSVEEDCVSHTVNIDESQADGGSVNASVSLVNMGEEVQLAITINEGMRLGSLTVYNITNPENTIPVYSIDKANLTYGFLMPPFDVVVTASFVPETIVDESTCNPVSVFPNPASNQIMIEGEEMCSIEIYNLIGQIVFKAKMDGSMRPLSISMLDAGIYVIRVMGKHGNYGLSKLIIE